MKEKRIIQAGEPGSGSTLLLNIVHGLLAPDSPINLEMCEKFITKTHQMNFDKYLCDFKKYDLYFVVSERNIKVPKRYYKYNNIAIVRYENFIASPSGSYEKPIKHVFDKLREALPPEAFPPHSEEVMLENARNRIRNMNKKYEEIKHKPFSYWDKFYGIHGSHCSRDGRHPRWGRG